MKCSVFEKIFTVKKRLSLIIAKIYNIHILYLTYYTRFADNGILLII